MGRRSSALKEELARIYNYMGVLGRIGNEMVDASDLLEGISLEPYKKAVSQAIAMFWNNPLFRGIVPYLSFGVMRGGDMVGWHWPTGKHHFIYISINLFPYPEKLKETIIHELMHAYNESYPKERYSIQRYLPKLKRWLENSSIHRFKYMALGRHEEFPVLSQLACCHPEELSVLEEEVKRRFRRRVDTLQEFERLKTQPLQYIHA